MTTLLLSLERNLDNLEIMIHSAAMKLKTLNNIFKICKRQREVINTSDLLTKALPVI